MSQAAAQGWIEQVAKAVLTAGEHAKLPPPIVHGFDGDSWVWTWRHESDGNRKVGPRIAEVQVRAHPDPLGEGIATEVAAASWVPDQRQLSWARTFAASFVTFKDLAHASDALADELTQSLAAAWRAAADAADRLEDVAQRRAHTARELKDRGLLA